MGLIEQIKSRFVRSSAKDVITPAKIDQKKIENVQIEKAQKGKTPALLSAGTINYLEYSDPNAVAQLQSYEGWVYACVRKISTSTAASKWLLFEKRNSGSEELEKHEIIDLLEKPNDRLTKYDLIELTTTFLELTGEAFWYKIRDNRGKVVGLWPWLMPQNMTIIPGGETLIKGYIYTVPGTGTQYPFAIEDIIYFNFPNPLNFVRGTSPVRAGGLDIATEKQAKIFNWRFFKNNARPAGTLETDQKLDQDTYDRLRAAWEGNHQGEANAYRPAILEQGLKYSEMGMSQKDMDFLEQRKFSRDAILSLFGVPKTVLGIVEDVNRANAEVSKMVFLEETVEPLVRKLLNIINEQLISVDFQDNLYLDYEDLTPEDQTKKLEYYSNGLNNGWISTNEVREIEGFAPVKNGDDIYIPFNRVPLGQPDMSGEEKSLKKRKFHIEKLHTTEYDKAYSRARKTVRKSIQSIQTKSKKAEKSPACRMDQEPMNECMSRKIPEIMNENPSMDHDQAIAIAAETCRVSCSDKAKKKVHS